MLFHFSFIIRLGFNPCGWNWFVSNQSFHHALHTSMPSCSILSLQSGKFLCIPFCRIISFQFIVLHAFLLHSLLRQVYCSACLPAAFLAQTGILFCMPSCCIPCTVRYISLHAFLLHLFYIVLHAFLLHLFYKRRLSARLFESSARFCLPPYYTSCLLLTSFHLLFFLPSCFSVVVWIEKINAQTLHLYKKKSSDF